MNTKQLTVTIPYELFNQMIILHELDNQDEVDNYIFSLIDHDLETNVDKDAIYELLRGKNE